MSSLGRLGLLTHATAGFIDPGFSGHVTLELSNVATLPIKLWPGMKIGQLCFFRLTSPAENPYGSAVSGSHYQGSAARRRAGRISTSTAPRSKGSLPALAGPTSHKFPMQHGNQLCPQETSYGVSQFPHVTWETSDGWGGAGNGVRRDRPRCHRRPWSP